MRFCRLITLLIFMIVGATLSEAPARPDRNVEETRESFNHRARSRGSVAWADSVMSTLSLRQRVAQLFIPHLVIKDDAAGRALVSKMVRTEGVGGILLGKGTIDSYVSLINRARREANVPLMVTLDGEWGPAMRLIDVPRFPYNMALGAVNDKELLRAYGREVARQCKALGIDVDFAPVADVNSNPSNPVIGYRSFGENPHRVADAVVAFSRGMEEGGVLSVAKHFPGHGDTSSDSHKTLPTVNHSMERLEETDLVPFQRYINYDLSGVMVGHLRVPAVDQTGTPASLSSPITTHLLINQMGFDGLVFTDALAMKGAITNGNNCVAAIKAGADILLGSASPSKDIDDVVNAVRNGILSNEQIDNKCRKLLAYKYALGLNRNSQDLSADEARNIINGKEGAELRRRLASACLIALNNSKNLFPVSTADNHKIAVVSFGASANNGFADRCKELGNVDLFGVTESTPITQSLISKLDRYDVVIAPVFSNSASIRTSFGKLSTNGSLIGVFFMNPYKLKEFGGRLRDLPGLIVAGDDTPEIRVAAANAVFGKEEISGRLPVNIEGVAKVGAGHTIKSRVSDSRVYRMSAAIDSIMALSLEERAFPGAQVVVMRNGRIIHSGNYGFTDYSRNHRVNDSTLYDLASVTKATATLSGLMKAYDEGLFRLDDPVSKYVEGLQRPDKLNITFRQMLFHESGFPATIGVQRFFCEGEKNNRRFRHDLVSTKCDDEFDTEMARGLYVGTHSLDTLMNRIYNVKLKSKTYRYSDLNFCLLREALENMTGVTLDQWVETEIFIPAGIDNLFFNPLERTDVDNIAPTERDDGFRHQLLHGYVHDETAAVSGGVQGNAGLFGSAASLARLCQLYLDGGRGESARILNQSTVNEFTTTSNRSGNRFLGFDRQPDGSPAHRSTYGHNGFTGTCFWVDPVNKLVIVFLSNRVHPSRSNQAFNRLKPRTAVIEAIYSNLEL